MTWHATSKLDIAGGLRYSHNKLTQEQIASGLLVSANPEKSSSEDVTTYLANLRYLANDNLMAYLRFATGYRPGGPNFVLNDPETGQPLAPPTFESDKLKSYEGGLKVSTADRRFSADAALYLIDWQNMQVVANINGFGVIANAGTARSTGAELTLTALPVPALTMVGAFAYMKAELTEDAPDLGGKDGDSLPNTPDFTAAVSADYAFDVSGHASTAGAVVRYVSRSSVWLGRGQSAPVRRAELHDRRHSRVIRFRKRHGAPVCPQPVRRAGTAVGRHVDRPAVRRAGAGQHPAAAHVWGEHRCQLLTWPGCVRAA